jgi:hypothetical protein
MAVVPTAHHVTLRYGTTGADQLGKLASLGGVVGLGMLITLHPPVMRQPAGTPETPASPTRDDEPEADLPSRSEDEGEPVANAGQELDGPRGPEPEPNPVPEAGPHGEPGDDVHPD